MNFSCSQFPYSNPDRIVAKLRKALAGKRAEFTESLSKADVTGSGTVPLARFTLALNRTAGIPLNDHEIRTLANKFNAHEGPVVMT